MPPTLGHTTVTADDPARPERWMYILHGIFGMGRNWGSVARRVVDARPEWGVVLVDIRNHGSSRGFPPPHTVAAAAADLRSLADTEDHRPDVLLGHSFGGKVVLQAVADGHLHPAQVWLIDSTPEARSPEGTAWGVIESLRALPGPFESRTEAVDGLVGRGYPKPLAQWLAMNVQPDDDGRYHWRIDADVMEEMLRDFFDRDLWTVVEDPPEDTELHVVKATRSDTLSDAAVKRLEGVPSARVHLHRIRGGHWLNADNPGALVDLLAERLP